MATESGEARELAFLLTDIEGSSAAWERDADAMGRAVVRHYELLDEHIAAHRGVRPAEQGEGDSTVSVFASPLDAATAALEAQRALHREVWPTSEPIRVRMAVHTGEATRRGADNYMGRTIIRAARIRSCGHGGQILVGQSTARHLAGTLDPPVEMTDLGLHRLRDLTEPETIHQLQHPELDRAFPPLRSLDAYRHNLPVEQSRFVGRERELAALREIVGVDRIVTMTGAGGCGKTRLALQLAAAAIDSFPDGAWIVELAGLGDGRQLPLALARAVGISEQPGRDPTDVLCERLNGRRLLVVLDNCEHVLDPAAQLVARLSSRVPGLAILATSREPLGVPGEVTWRVPSMGVDAAVLDADQTDTNDDAWELFVERARRARPTLTIDARADVVREICHRLDGIPLAIELAAARCRSLAPERVLDELDDRFRLLTGGPRTVMPRQQTLESSVDWSYALLDDDEASVFRRLAVFVGPFTMPAAEAVGSSSQVDSAAVFGTVLRLVDKSLVQSDADGRYRLLETIRQFALARLDRDELTGARDHHASWHLAWLESMGHAGEDASTRAIDRSYANVRAAAIWSLTDPEMASSFVVHLARPWFTLGRHDDARSLGDQLLDTANADPTLWAVAVCHLAIARLFGGDVDFVFASLPKALELLDPESEPAAVAAGRYALGPAGLDRDPNRHELIAELDHRAGGEHLTGWCQRAMTLQAVGTPRFAALADRSDESAARLGITSLRVLCSLDRGADADARGEPRDALQHFLRAWSDATDLAEPTIALLAAGGAIQSYVFLGELDAADHLRASIDERRADWGNADVWIQLVDQLRDLAVDGTTPTALPELSGLAIGAKYRVYLALAMDDHELAQIEADRPSIEFTFESEGLTPFLRGQVAHAAGEIPKALTLYRTVLANCVTYGWPLLASDALECLAALSQPTDAVRYLGLTARHRVELGLVWRYPHQQRWVDDAATAARAALGDDAYDAAWAEAAQSSWQDTASAAARRRSVRSTATTGWNSLTPAELDVVGFVAEGLSNAQIAERMFIAVATVKTHLHHIYEKLDLPTRTALTAAAVRRQDPV